MKKCVCWLVLGFSFLSLGNLGWANVCADSLVAGGSPIISASSNLAYDPAAMGGLSPNGVTRLLGMLHSAARIWQNADPASDPDASEKHALAAQVLSSDFMAKDIQNVIHTSHHHRIVRYEKDPTQPFYNGNNYPGMRIIENSFGGWSYESINHPANPIVKMSLWPGYGSNISHSGSFLTASDTFTRYANVLFQELAMLMIKNKGILPAEILTEIMDLVNSGNGPRSDENNFNGLDDFVKRMVDYLRITKARSKLPLVLLLRSASAGLGLSVIQQYPNDLVDGVILIGPTHADLDIGYRSSMAAFLFKLHKGEMVGNFPAITWIDKMYHQMTWQNDPDPFHGIPTLVLIGSEDTEVSPEARQWFQEMAKKYRNVRVHILEGSDHDVLAIANFARSRNRVSSAHHKLKQDLARSVLIYNVFSILHKYQASPVAFSDINDLALQGLVERYSVAHYGRQWGSELASNLESLIKAHNDEKRKFIIGKINQLLAMPPMSDASSPSPSFAQNIVGDLHAIETEERIHRDIYNPLKAYELIENFLIRNFQKKFVRYLKEDGQENSPNTVH